MREEGIQGQEGYRAEGAARGEPECSSGSGAERRSSGQANRQHFICSHRSPLPAFEASGSPPPSLPRQPPPDAAESLPCPLEHILSEVFRCYQARSPEELMALLKRRYRWASLLRHGLSQAGVNASASLFR